MEYDLVSQKLDQNNHLVKNKVTNEPVAFLEKRASRYGGKGTVHATWHPDYKLLHPEIHDNLITRNFEKPYESVTDAVSGITYKTRPHAYGRNVPKDPIKTKYIGVAERGGETAHNWSMHDDNGEHIGNLTSAHGPEEIHRESPVKVTWKKEYLDKNTIPDSVKEAAAKKHTGDKLESTLSRVRYMLDNKNKEPRFIGTQTSDKSEIKMFKTKLAPEDASAAYEEHLQKKLGRSYKFTRHSPTSFSAVKPADSIYSNTSHHHIISLPGELHHITSHTSHPEYYSAKKNAEIVESYAPPAKKKFEALSLETYMKVAKVIR